MQNIKESKYYKYNQDFKINDYISTNGSIFKVIKKNEYTIEVLQVNTNQLYVLGNKLLSKKIFKNSIKIKKGKTK